VTLGAVGVLLRPLLLSSTLPEVGEARGLGAQRMDIAFLLLVALATTVTIPVVGTFLLFSLMVAPAGTAQWLTDRPRDALLLSVALALLVAWAAIALSYASNWPVGFFVGALGAVAYAAGRLVAARRGRRAGGAPFVEGAH
jgi:zinc/manganese transport system permease protein